MSQIDELVSGLKKALKAKNITYLALAEKLSLSESSVKRLFASKGLTLKRIEKICELIDVSFVEIIKRCSFDGERTVYTFSIEEEKMFLKYPKLWPYLYALNDGFIPNEIVKSYQITKEEGQKLLLKLDKMNLITLLPYNKVSIVEDRLFGFEKNGKMYQMTQKSARTTFINHQFDGKENYFRFLPALWFDEKKMKVFHQKMNNLIKEALREREYETKINPDEKIYGMLVALRDWVPSGLAPLKKRDN